MARLEEIKRGATLRGVLPNSIVTVIDVQWHGSTGVEMTFKDASGRPGNQLLYWDDEPQLEIVPEGQPWRFDAAGNLLRLVSEARRIRHGHPSTLHL